MPELYCRKCGTQAEPADLFCRICGSALSATGTTTEGSGDTTLERGQNGPVGRKARRPWRTACLGVGLLIAVVALAAIFIIPLAIRPGGRPVLAMEMIGSSSPYPTRPPYRTATPYNKTPTPYPTRDFYPTTGALATIIPTPSAPGEFVVPRSYPYVSFNNNCHLIVDNQYYDLDAVVMLIEAETFTMAASNYVRARDSYSSSGIGPGTYYTYIALGQDWEAATRLFRTDASYYRFTDPITFDTCNTSWTYSGYQYLTVTLNTTEGPGSDIIYLLPDEFPGSIP